MTKISNATNTAATQALMKLMQDAPGGAGVKVTARQFEALSKNLEKIAHQQPDLARNLATLIGDKWSSGEFSITGLNPIPSAAGAVRNAVSALMSNIHDITDGGGPAPNNPGLVR
jgi:hypothetical protein